LTGHQHLSIFTIFTKYLHLKKLKWTNLLHSVQFFPPALQHYGIYKVYILCHIFLMCFLILPQGVKVYDDIDLQDQGDNQGNSQR